MFSQIVQSTIKDNQLDSPKNLKEDRSTWLQQWVSSFHGLVAEKKINDVFHYLVRQKIEKSDNPNLFNVHTHLLTDEANFLYELFLSINLHFYWLDPDTLNEIDLESEIELIFKHKKLKKADYLKDEFQVCLMQWIKEEVQRIQAYQGIESRYVDLFHFFLKAYLAEFVEQDEKQVEAFIQQIDDELIIKLMGEKYIYHVIQQYCLKHNLFNDPFLGEYNEDMEAYLQMADQQQVYLKMVTKRLSGLAWAKAAKCNIKKVSLECEVDMFDERNQDVIVDHIAKERFDRIQIKKNDVLVFLYDKQNGIVNHHWLNEKLYDEAIVLWQLNLIGMHKPSFGFNSVVFCRQTGAHVFELAAKAVKNKTDEVSLDETLPFSQLGEMGITQFLYQLDYQFETALTSNHIEKPFTLYIPNKDNAILRPLPVAAIRGLINYLKKKENQKNAVLSFQHLVLAINFTNQQTTNDVLNSICELLPLLDRLKLKQLTLPINEISPTHVDALAEAFKKVSLRIVLNGAIAFEDLLTLQAINDEQLQMKVPYAFTESSTSESKQWMLINQPQPITVAKIQALMNQTLYLSPLQGKVGIQNQYQFQENTHQQAEVTITQSWQVQENQQVKQESRSNFYCYLGKDETNFISWFDIQAAMNTKNENHEQAKKKLGDELINYQFKNRDLIDLWQRITGDITLTEQQIVSERRSLYEDPHPFYSRHVPKRVHKELLLMMVQHPHAFQDGVSLSALPDNIGYDTSLGTLIYDPTSYFKSKELPSVFAPRFTKPHPIAQPVTKFYHLLTTSVLPSQKFFKACQSHFSDHIAWLGYRSLFAVLNTFNEQGIRAMNALLHEILPKTAAQGILLSYVIKTFQYYHYQKMFYGNDVLTNQQYLFEEDLQSAYLKGDLTALSKSDQQQLPTDVFSLIHRIVVDIFNNKNYVLSENDIEKSDILFILTEILSPTVTKLSLEKILSLLSINDSFKLLALALSEHDSVIENICLSLNALYQTWGEVGLKDFSAVFITPCIHLFELSLPPQQKMINHLLLLTPIQYHWWQQLSLQHAAQSGYSDIAELMPAFQTFLNELEQLGLKNALMMPCPIQGISNMVVALDRLLTVLKKAKKPWEQFQQLQGLDWHASGVILAVQEHEFQYVSANMKLDTVTENAICQFVDTSHHYYRPFYHYDVELIANVYVKEITQEEVKEKLFDLTLTTFYRYISSKKYTAPLTVYEQYLQALILPTNYTLAKNQFCHTHYDHHKKMIELPFVKDGEKLLLTAFLKLLAFATTGPRALDRLLQTEKERHQQFTQLIEAFYECHRIRSHIIEDDQYCENIKAVHYGSLLKGINDFQEFCVNNHYLDENETGKFPRLDLSEMTTLLRLLKQSDEYYYNILKTNDKLVYELSSSIKKINGWECHDVFGRIDNQTLFSKQLLKKYKEYFIQVIARFQNFNKESDFACFLLVSLNLEKMALSDENKGRLLRLLSVIKFESKKLMTDIEVFIIFLESLKKYQLQFGDQQNDRFIRSISSILPSKNGYFTIQQLNNILNTELQFSLDKLAKTPEELIETYLSHAQLDVILVESKEVGFYESSYALDCACPGLGQFYLLIKEILLQRYKVAFDHEKTESWQYFLKLIHALENASLQRQVLEALLQTELKNVDLTTLNEWLSALLNIKKDRVPVNPKYLQILSNELIKHPSAEKFINAIRFWFNYPRFHFTEKDHLAYLTILNVLAKESAWAELIEIILEMVRNIAYLDWEETLTWHEQCLQLLNVFAKETIATNEIINIIEGFKQLFKLRYKDDTNASTINRLLIFFIQHIEKTYPLILLITKEWKDTQAKQLLQILSVLGQATIDLEKLYNFLKNADLAVLEKIASCYQGKPIPSDVLLMQLVNGAIDIHQFVAAFTIDPHGERTPEKLNQQFNNDVLWPYLARVTYYDEEESNSLSLKQTIIGQLQFINQIGFDESRHLSLHEIGERLKHCRELMVETADHDQQQTITLTALALIREAVYKSSQAPMLLWPTAIQLLALLHSLHHTSISEQPLFLQMATGEGKSLFALMQALLQWVQGGGVAIVMHRASHALRDANQFNYLFESLDIELKYLTAKKYRFYQFLKSISQKKNTKLLDGIYYLEFNELALLREQMIIDEIKDIEKLSFIIDEADEIMLHNQTDNNLTKGDRNEDHVHYWVFEALSAYVLENKSPFLSIKLSEVVQYLQKHYPPALRACQQIEFLEKLPAYVEASWLANSLQEKIDYIPKSLDKEKGSFYAAILLNDKAMPANVTFNGLIQQALHGRLNYFAKKELTNKYFPIASETMLYATMSPEAVLQWMRKIGRVIAVSATIGSPSERLEIREFYQFRLMKLPKLQSIDRLDYPDQFCGNKTEQLKTIASLCEYYTKNRKDDKLRAILITVESIDFAEEVKQFLIQQKKNYIIDVLHAGEEVSDATMSEMEERAGVANHILIAMNGLIARGFDIKLKTATQTIVISTDLSNEVTEDQKKGRASRMNAKTGRRDKGKFYGIYDLEKERKRYPDLNIPCDDLTINPELFKQRQYFAHYQQEASLRLYRRLASVGKDVIQTHFTHFWLSLADQPLLSKQRDEILTLFTSSLNEIVTLIPLSGFVNDTNDGKAIRENYNQKLSNMYAEKFVKMQALLGVTEKDTSLVPYLMMKMQSEQEQILQIHTKAIQRGPENAKQKIHKQWKQGVNYNAYLYSGKQGITNYVVNGLYGFFLSKENKQKLHLAKIALREKLLTKQKAKCDFMTQLILMMEVTGGREPFFNQSITSEIANKHQCIEISKTWDKNNALTCLCDPNSGDLLTINLSASRFFLFENFQKILHDISQQYPMKNKLSFKIRKISSTLPAQYEVMFDFTRSDFTSENKKMWLQAIAKEMQIDLSPVLPKIMDNKISKNP